MRFRNRLGVGVGVGLLCGAALAAPAAATTAPQTQATVVRSTTLRVTDTRMVNGMTLTRSVNDAGDTVTTLSDGPATLGLLGPTTRTMRAPGSTRTASMPGEQGVTVSSPAYTGTDTPTRRMTVVQTLTALGESASDAARMSGLDSATDAPTTGRASTTAAATASDPYGSPQCVTFDADSNLMHSYGCAQAYLIYQSGGNRYFELRYQVIGYSRDTGNWFPDDLTGLAGKESWVSGNHVYEWSPAATHRTGSCSTFTAHVSVHNVGFDYSHEFCPERIDPYYVAYHSAGSHWSGDADAYTYEDAHGLQAVYESPGHYSGRQWTLYMWWE